MLSDTIPNIPKKIFNFLTLEAERKGKEHGFKRRSSKLTPSAFLKALIEVCLQGHFNLELFCSNLNTQKISITKQSLHERLNERTVAFIKALASFCFTHFQTTKLPHLHTLEGFSSVNIVDSSSVSLHHSLSHLFKGSGGMASSAAMKIQMMFDGLSGQIKELMLTSGCDNDQGFDNYFRRIEPGALYLMDLGYFKLGSFKRIIDGSAFFVSRLLTGTKVLTRDNQPLNLLSTLTSGGAFFSQEILLGAQYKLPMRLIAQRLSNEVANKRRLKLRKDYRRRGITPSKELLALHSWSIYITNTLESQIRNDSIHQVYALRWQIELVFKLSKSLMNIDIINTTNSNRVLIETYGKFIAMMLFFLLCSPLREIHGKQLSFYKACQHLMARATELSSALSSLYQLKLFLLRFYDNLSRFALKDTKKKPSSLFEGSVGDGF